MPEADANIISFLANHTIRLTNGFQLLSRRVLYAESGAGADGTVTQVPISNASIRPKIGCVIIVFTAIIPMNENNLIMEHV